MSVERLAYVFLAGGFTAVPFSLPLGRILFAISLVLLVVHLVREKERPSVSAAGWLALAFVLATIWATAIGLDPRKGFKELDKLVWFVVIPVAATLVSSSRRLTRLLRGYAVGSLILCGRLFAKAWEAGAEALAEGKTDAGWDALCRGLDRAPDEAHDFWWALMDASDITDAQLVMVGMVMTVGFVFMAVRNRSRTGWLWGTAFLVQLSALFLQFKRGSWLTAAVVLFFFVLLKARWIERLFKPVCEPVAKRWRIVVPIVLLALVCAGFTPPVKSRLSESCKQVMERAETQRPGQRLCMWFVVTPAIIKEHPGGIGWCVLNEDLMRQYCRHIEKNRKTLHCNLAQILVATGWLGLAVYLLWMGKALFDAVSYAYRANDRSTRTELCAAILLLVLLALMLNGLVECNLRKGDITLVYAVTMGAAAAGRLRLRDRSAGKSSGQSVLPE